MYILMCGAGLGFTAESENVHKLPQIKKQKGGKVKRHVVGDDKEGWADALVLGLKTWYNGGDIEFDYSEVRPAGARLVTAGGRASGPEPLVTLMSFARSKILAKQGKRLSNINVHDIICKIGEVVVAGGVRRSALISLSELDDLEMRDAKKGQFYISDPQRSLANNSTIYDSRPTAEEFLDEWTALVKSKSGERGIFNRGSLLKQIPERRRKTWKEQEQPGVNPCGEILLRSKQFCNLTSIVVRKEDTLADMKRKIRLATILGTYQASLTDFGYLSKEWKKNCDEEALLGVSITGYYDNELVRTDGVLNKLRKYSVEVNKKYAKKVGVKQSASITCVKPHGNSSQLLDTASGMHPRFAEYYVRRVRINHTDPLLQLAKDQGVPCYPEVGQSQEHATAFVLEFPVKSPKNSVFKDDISAIDLLKEWKRLKENFTHHNPSATIYVSDDEWMKVSNFVYENWEVIGGLTFLPRSDHIYQLAPYEEIDKKEYNKRIKEIGKLDFSKLMQYENQDNTQGSKEYACVGGLCELDDVDVVDLAKKRATS
jgi:ribonucleoside-diphosphate reductase alpha chain